MSELFSFSGDILATGADRGTPVSLYANLRLLFPETLLLECGEYDSPQNARSYLCADPIVKFSIKNDAAFVDYEGRRIKEIRLNGANSAVAALEDFQKSLRIDCAQSAGDLCGLFGYIGYSAIPHLEDIRFPKEKSADEEIPDLQFALYRYVFRFDHFQNQITAAALRKNDGNGKAQADSLSELLEKITYRRAPEYGFERVGDESGNMSDDEFAETVRLCQRHIRRGDVFQIVPSRKFVQPFRGDEFEVYRALRRINPSPFLFFFDYGNFSLFGSSPEAQLLVRGRRAALRPIAGTYPRGASASEDLEFAEKLRNDPKENAEHVMLVDLARNDLGRNCRSIAVESFKKIELYSHVMHLVSQVTGRLNEGATAARILADTFPAGTLSGAPKYRAMEIINELEPTSRSFYGGCVGFFGADGSCTQAIMIRTFLARRRKLIFQAGAGIVADSVPEREAAEVSNKLGALRRAILLAEGNEI